MVVARKKMPPTDDTIISPPSRFKKVKSPRMGLLATVIVFAIIGAYFITNSFAETPALTHTNNTLVRLKSGQEVYVIDSGKLRLATEPVLKSHGYSLGEVRNATAGDERLPKGEPLNYAEGTLVKDADKQYFTVEENGKTKKRLIKASALLDTLNAKSVTTVDVSTNELPSEDATPVEDTEPTSNHPAGTVVLAPDGTNYLIENGKKREINSYSAYKTNKIENKQITTENEVDQKLPIGEPLQLKEGSLIRGNDQTTYIIEKSSKTKTLTKRPIRSDEVLLELGYQKSEIVRIPEAEVSALPSGPPIPESPAAPLVVIVSPKDGEDTTKLSQQYKRKGAKIRLLYPTVFSMEVPYSQVEQLKKDPKVERVSGNAQIVRLCDFDSCDEPAPSPPPPPPPAPSPTPPPAPSPGTPSPYINTWYFNGSNSWTYGVDSANKCEVHLSNGGIQPFTPSLGGVFTVTAGSGNLDGKIKCWNGSVGPVESGWAGPSGNPNPPAPSGQTAPSIVTWAFISGNAWSYSVKNSTYCEVKLTNNGIQPFTPTNDGTYTVTAGNGGMQGQLSCWNNSVGPAVSAMVGPTAPPPTPTPPPAPAPSSYPPLNDWPPSISGSASVGATLSADPGTWKNGVIDFTYSWLRCTSIDSQGYPVASSCVAAATPFSSNAYTIVSADQGSRIAIRVTATNSAGSTSVYSKATAVVPGGTTSPQYPPLNDYPPTITGSATTGSMLNSDAGSWKNGVNSYAYAWQRCSSVDSQGFPVASSCTSATPVNSSSYKVVSADEGKRLAVRVTATNNYGSASVYSKATAVVKAPSSTPTASCNTPINTVAPALSGTARSGSTLTTTNGSWNANCSGVTLTFYYGWWRCTTTTVSSCVYVPKSPLAAYTNKLTLTSNEVNKYIRSSVTACFITSTKTACSDAKYSNPSSKVTSSGVVTTPVVTIDSFTSDQGTTIKSGSNLTLRWKSTNAASCSGSSTPSNTKWDGSRAVAGSVDFGPVVVTATTKVIFTLRCTNGASTPASKSIEITIEEVVTPGMMHLKRVGWTNRGAGSTVAVVDTGVNPSTKYLNNVAAGYNCVTRQAGNAGDNNGHGTKVAGVIGATGNGADSPIGVAPGTRIFPVKVIDNGQGGSDENFICALQEAQRAGVRIVNISMTGKEDAYNDDGNCGPSVLFRQICDFQGVIVIGTPNQQIGFSLRNLSTHSSAVTVTPMHDTNAKPPSAGAGPASPCGGADDTPAPYSAFADGNEISHTVSAPSCIPYTLNSDGSVDPNPAAGASFATPVVTGIASLCNCRPSTNSSPSYFNNVFEGRTYGPLVRF